MILKTCLLILSNFRASENLKSLFFSSLQEGHNKKFLLWGKEKVTCLCRTEQINSWWIRKPQNIYGYFSLDGKGQRQCKGQYWLHKATQLAISTQLWFRTVSNLCALVDPFPPFLNRSGCVNCSISVYHWTWVVRVRTCLLNISLPKIEIKKKKKQPESTELHKQNTSDNLIPVSRSWTSSIGRIQWIKHQHTMGSRAVLAYVFL